MGWRNSWKPPRRTATLRMRVTVQMRTITGKIGRAGRRSNTSEAVWKFLLGNTRYGTVSLLPTGHTDLTAATAEKMGILWNIQVLHHSLQEPPESGLILCMNRSLYIYATFYMESMLTWTCISPLCFSWIKKTKLLGLYEWNSCHHCSKTMGQRLITYLWGEYEVTPCTKLP